MNPETATTETTGTATYSPEDNKLRLYIGRVPRAEYEALRAEGWKALYKQREAGGGDFVATWTPERRDTALRYSGGVIEDEDMGPAERAADRAERFSGYRDKRTDEATGHADRYDAAPAAHGFQNPERAERAAARHDRIADRAGDAWEKAEYWTRRTAGVIAHALYKSSPSVRMGRIKELEAGIRKAEGNRAEYAERFARWTECAAMTDAAEQAKRARLLAGSESSCYSYKHPRPEQVKNAHVREHGSSLYTLIEMSDGEYGEPISGAEACAIYLATHRAPAGEGPWLTHYRLRLAYESQMLEASGGRAGEVEMIPGGWLIGGRRLSSEERQIVKVNKSHVTGRVVSVLVRDNHASSVNHWGNPYPDGVKKVLCHTVEVERASPDAYRAPTPEELTAFEAGEKAAKKARKASAPAPIPLVNPTDKDAARLVELWNSARRGEWERQHSESMRQYYPFKPCEVRRMPQAFYSANSKGSYAKAETKELCALGRIKSHNSFCDYSRQAQRDAERGPAVCQIRTTGYDPLHVIILTDKPQKPLPAALWTAFQPAPVVPAFALEYA